MITTAPAANSLRDFFAIMAYRFPPHEPPQGPKPSKPEYTITFSKFPYNHTSKDSTPTGFRPNTSRKYEYNVGSEFEIYSCEPYKIDLIAYFETTNRIKYFFTKRIYAYDQDYYKQIVIHYRTYTGVFNIAHGRQEKVMEVRMN